MITMNTQSMVDQKFLLKEYYPGLSILFHTEERKTKRGHIYFWFDWIVGDLDEVSDS